jgi:hypothetical protein
MVVVQLLPTNSSNNTQQQRQTSGGQMMPSTYQCIDSPTPPATGPELQAQEASGKQRC